MKNLMWMRSMFLAACLISMGCQCKRALSCASANGDAEACRAMHEDCNTSGGPTCRGAFCGNCEPDVSSATCRLARDAAARCPGDVRIFSGGRVGDLGRYDWKMKDLSPKARALANTQIAVDDFELLTPNDRHALCTNIPADPCTLRWNVATALAECVLPATSCEGCQYVVEPVQCTAINKCSGVICL